MVERRSRTTKGIVVCIDGDSQSCERIAEALEIHGYHVLAIENPWEGVELVRIRRPDAVVVASDPEDDASGLRGTVTRHLLAHAALILRYRESVPDGHTDGAEDDDSRVLRVHSSLGADGLRWLLDQAVETLRR
jgi:hypothetical protein